MNAKEFAQAQGKFEQAVKLDPEFAEAYNNLAFTLRKQGSANFQKSLAYYNKADPTKRSNSSRNWPRRTCIAAFSTPKWDARLTPKRT
jgi:tetratricopeptide (TPR) repeat protein